MVAAETMLTAIPSVLMVEDNNDNILDQVRSLIWSWTCESMFTSPSSPFKIKCCCDGGQISWMIISGAIKPGFFPHSFMLDDCGAPADPAGSSVFAVKSFGFFYTCWENFRTQRRDIKIQFLHPRLVVFLTEHSGTSCRCVCGYS